MTRNPTSKQGGLPLKKQKSSDITPPLFEGMPAHMFLTENPGTEIKKDFSTRMSKLYSKKKNRLHRKRRQQDSIGLASAYMTMNSTSELAYTSGPFKLEEKERGHKRNESLNFQQLYSTQGNNREEEMRAGNSPAEQRGRGGRRASKSPLTNRAPGSQYQKLLRKKKRGKKKKQLEPEPDMTLKLIEGLTQISERTRQLEISSRFSGKGVDSRQLEQILKREISKKQRDPEYLESLKELDGMLSKKSSKRYVLKKKTDPSPQKQKERRQEQAKAKSREKNNEMEQWVNSSDPRLRALGKNIKAAKSYKQHLNEVAKKDIEKSRVVNQSKSFINIYRKKSKKKRKRKREEGSLVSNFDEKFIQDLENEKMDVSPDRNDDLVSKLSGYISVANQRDVSDNENEDLDLNVANLGEGEKAEEDVKMEGEFGLERVELEVEGEGVGKSSIPEDPQLQRESNPEIPSLTKESSKPVNSLNPSDPSPLKQSLPIENEASLIVKSTSQVLSSKTKSTSQVLPSQMKSRRTHKKAFKSKKNFFEINKLRLAEKQKKIRLAKEDKQRREERAKKEEEAKNRSTHLVKSNKPRAGPYPVRRGKRNSVNSMLQKNSILSKSNAQIKESGGLYRSELEVFDSELKDKVEGLVAQPLTNRGALVKSDIIQEGERKHASIDKINHVMKELRNNHRDSPKETPKRKVASKRDRSVSKERTLFQPNQRKNSSVSRDGYYRRAKVSRDHSKKSLILFKEGVSKIDKAIQNSRVPQGEVVEEKKKEKKDNKKENKDNKKDNKEKEKDNKEKEKAPELVSIESLKKSVKRSRSSNHSPLKKSENTAESGNSRFTKKLSKSPKRNPASTNVLESAYLENNKNMENDLIGVSKVIDNSQVVENFTMKESGMSQLYPNPFDAPAIEVVTREVELDSDKDQGKSKTKENIKGMSKSKGKNEKSKPTPVPTPTPFAKKRNPILLTEVISNQKNQNQPLDLTKRPYNTPQFKPKPSRNPRLSKPEEIALNMNKKIMELSRAKLGKSQSLQKIQILTGDSGTIEATDQTLLESNFMSVNHRTGGEVVTPVMNNIAKKGGLVESRVVGKGTELLMPKPKPRKCVKKETPKIDFMERNKRKLAAGEFKKPEKKDKDIFLSRLRASQSVATKKKGMITNRIGKQPGRDTSLRIQSNIKSLRNNLPLSKRSYKGKRRRPASNRDLVLDAESKRRKEEQDLKDKEKRKAEEFKNLKKKFEKKFFEQKQDKEGSVNYSKRESRRTSKREISRREISRRENSVPSQKSGDQEREKKKASFSVKSPLRPGVNTSVPAQKTKTNTKTKTPPKTNFIERNKIKVREKMEQRKKVQEEKKKAEEMQRSRFFGVSKFDGVVESRINTGSRDKLPIMDSQGCIVPQKEKPEKSEQPGVQNENHQKEVDLHQATKVEADKKTETNVPPVKTVAKKEVSSKTEAKVKAFKSPSPTNITENPISIQTSSSKPPEKLSSKSSSVVSKTKSNLSGSTKTKSTNKSGNRSFNKNEKRGLEEDKQRLIDNDWNTSTKMKKQVFKKRKEYVNPVAVKPRVKRPTTEIDIELLKMKAKENQMKKKLEERRQAIEATRRLMEEEDFIILDKVIDKDRASLVPEITSKDEVKEAKELMVKTKRITKTKSMAKGRASEKPKEEELVVEKTQKTVVELPTEIVKKVQIPEEPQVQTIMNRFGRIDHKMRINLVELECWEKQEEAPPPEPSVKLKIPEKIKLPEVNESLVNRLMEKYAIKTEIKVKREEIQPKETKETKESKDIPEIGDLRSKLELMKERLNENRMLLKKEIEEEVQKNETMSKVKNMDKYRKKGLKKREKMGNSTAYGYPVYKPKPSDPPGREARLKKREEPGKESSKEEIDREAFVKPEEDIEIEEVIENKEENAGESEDKAINIKEDSDMDDIKAMCRNIIKEKIEEEEREGKADEEVSQVRATPNKANPSLPLRKNSSINNSFKSKSQSKSRSKPKRKIRSKKNIKPIKGGYLSKYSSKISEAPEEENPKKVPRFSSKSKRPRLRDTKTFEPILQSKQAPPKKPAKKKRQSKKESKDDMKVFGNRTLESIASLGFNGELSKDFSMTIGFQSSRVKEESSSEKQPPKVHKRKSRKAATKKRKRKKRKSADSRGSKRRNNTSLEEVERKSPRVELERKDSNLPSRSQAPKKPEGTRRLTGREMSLGPMSRGSFPFSNMNKKTLRPLIKKESLERMSMSISKTRMFPQSKSKQQLLSNLEKLKKFKPLIKQSVDVFEKPRNSLTKQKFESPPTPLRLENRPSGDLFEQDAITEEGTSNYNTRNSYDDFMEIEKNIRKSVQIENLKGLVGHREAGKNKRGKTLDRDEDADNFVVDEIVELAIGKPSTKIKSKTQHGPAPQKKKKARRKAKKPRKTKRDIINEADHLAVDLEANLLKLKEEMEQEASASNDESVPISSMKGDYFHDLREYPEYARDSSAKEKRKYDRTKSMMSKSKSKTLSRTLDIKATKVITALTRNVEKQESLRDIITNNKMSLQWRKERIKEYGRVKKVKKVIKDEASEENPKKLAIRKLNSKFGRDSVQTPKKRSVITGEYESCMVTARDKPASRGESYDWLIENPNPNAQTNQDPQTPRRFESDSKHLEIKRQFKMATGEQTVTLKKIRHDKDQKDKHFANLLKRNANTRAQTDEQGLDAYASDTSQRVRRKHGRKSDVKKLGLDRLKNLNSKMQKRNSMFSEKEPMLTRVKMKSEGGARLLKGLNSKFGISGPREFQNNIEDVDGQYIPIISELGSASDLLVKNRLIENELKQQGIKTIPEFEEMPVKAQEKGDKRKEKYRRDRMKEYGQKLKVLSSHDRGKRTKVDVKEFLNNL